MADRREHVLYVKNVWWEPGVRQTKKLETALNGRLKSILYPFAEKASLNSLRKQD